MSLEQRLTFPNHLQEKLVGLIIPAQSAVKTQDAVILCHGLAGHKDDYFFPALASALSKRFHVLRLDFVVDLTDLARFDFSGNGESEGVFSFSNYDKEVEDLRSAITFMRNQHYHIHSIIGHSKGAGIVLLYGAKYDDIPNIVSISPRYDMTKIPPNRFTPQQLEELKLHSQFKWKEAHGRPLFVTQKALDEKDAVDMTVAKNIKKAQILLIHGNADNVIPYEDCIAFQKLFQKHQLNYKHHMVEGCGHFYTKKQHTKELIDTIMSWLPIQSKL